jgi:hypothetical protein
VRARAHRSRWSSGRAVPTFQHGSRDPVGGAQLKGAPERMRGGGASTAGTALDSAAHTRSETAPASGSGPVRRDGTRPRVWKQRAWNRDSNSEWTNTVP